MAVWTELLAGFARSGAEGGGLQDAGPASCCDLPGEHRLHLQGVGPAPDDRRCGDQPAPGTRAAQLSGEQDLALAAHIRSQPGITLAQARAWLLAEHEVELSLGATWNAARRLGLSFKTNPARGRTGPARRRGPAQAVESGTAVPRS